MSDPYKQSLQRPSSEAELVASACKLIDSSDQIPSLHELAAAIGYSRSHFHRLFKRVTGITPKQYATAQRSNTVREMLAKAGTVTDALYRSGFNSSSRFYEKSNEFLGACRTLAVEARIWLCEDRFLTIRRPIVVLWVKNRR